MSKLEKLIKELCPDGVEYKTLGEIGIFYGGLSGKTKDDFKDGNAKFISYMNVYSNLKLNLNTDEKVKIGENENQHTIEYGDVLFTGSSETPDECGISSVLADKTNEKLYLNSFSFGFRFNDKKLFNPEFSKYFFRSDALRKQIIKTASGVTRFNVSKEKMKKVSIPVPPLPVQEEIVRILDTFTELTKELTKELTERRRQYEYYRDALLTFDKLNGGGYSRRVKLGKIAVIMRGGNFQKKDFVESGLPCIHYGQMYTHFGTWADKTLTFVSKDVFEKSRQAHPSDIIMAVTSENVEDVCKCTAWVGSEPVAVSGHTAIIRHNQNAKYLSYFFQSAEFYRQKVKLAHGTKVIEVTPDKLNGIEIPLPPLDVQERLVRVLDNFDSICSDLKIGLPAEIEARKKQYEFYRDALLTFAESGRIAADNVGGGVSLRPN